MKRTLLHAALGAAFAATTTLASLSVAAPPVMSAGSAPFAAPPATAPGKNKLKCFDGPSEGAPQGGSCTMKGRGAMGPATLDVSSTDPDGDYAGVYYQEGSIYGAEMEGTVHALAPDGSIRWSKTLDPDAIFSAPAISSDGSVIFLDSHFRSNKYVFDVTVHAIGPGPAREGGH